MMNERETTEQVIKAVQDIKAVRDSFLNFGYLESNKAMIVLDRAIDAVLELCDCETDATWFIFDNDSGREGLPIHPMSENSELIRNTEEFLDFIYR